MAEHSLALQTQAAPAPAADYDQIFMAMMETPRGRWFLSEYAQRSRNANTELLLAAIARVETAVRPPTPEAASTKAGADREAALAKLVTEYGDKTHNLVKALRNAAHVIRDATENLQDLSWDLREQKYDDRLCDTIDGQTREITAACATLDHAIATAHDVAVIIASLDQNTELTAGLSATASDAGQPAQRAGLRAGSSADAAAPDGKIAWKEADIGRDVETEAAPRLSDWDMPEAADEKPSLQADGASGDDSILDAELFAPDTAKNSTAKPNGANAEAAASDDGIMSLSFTGAVESKSGGPSSNGWFFNFLTRISGENGASQHPESFRPKSTPDAATWSVVVPAERAEPVFDLPIAANGALRNGRPAKGLRRDAMAPIRAMSEEERIALFS